MLPLVPHSAMAQRRGIGTRVTFPSPMRETSAGRVLTCQVVLLRSRRRVATGVSLAALIGSVQSQNVSGRSSTFLRPFAPPALPGFRATMDALTPARSALRMGAHEHRPDTEQVSLLHGVKPSDRSVSNHPWPSSGSRSAFDLRGLPPDPSHDGRALRGQAYWASPFTSRLATTRSRIEFVILRTSRSPPIAPHPVLRRRSYLRLQSPDQTLAGTSTLPITRACRRTSGRIHPAGWSEAG